MIKFLAAMIIIMGFPPLVNAASAKTLADLVSEAQARGEDATPEPSDVENAHIPAGLPGKTLEVAEKESIDGSTHDFTVFFKNKQPAIVIFTKINAHERTEEYLNLVCDAKGKMNQCYLGVGTRDEQGKPIPGTGKFTHISPKDRGMNTTLKREMDFWLKGMYRKTATTTAKPAEKKAAH